MERGNGYVRRRDIARSRVNRAKKVKKSQKSACCLRTFTLILIFPWSITSPTSLITSTVSALITAVIPITAAAAATATAPVTAALIAAAGPSAYALTAATGAAAAAAAAGGGRHLGSTQRLRRT